MSIRKRVLALAFSLSLLLSLSVSSIYSSPQDPLSIFSEALTPLYYGDADSYTIFGKTANDITSTFLSNTHTFATQNDWASVQAYFTETVDHVERILSVETRAVPRSYDVAKTETKLYLYGPLTTTNGVGYAETVEYNQISTIYYNPNTGVISSGTSALRVVNLYPSTVQMSNQKSFSPTYNSGRTAATFRVDCEIIYVTTGQQGTFGTFNNYHTLNGSNNP